MSSDTAARAPRPLRGDAERNRQRILTAATELFADRGLAVTLDDIARHAGLGVGTVYRRFPSREHLVEALFEQRMEEIGDLAESYLDEPDPWAALTGFLNQTAELHASNHGLRELMLSTNHGQDKVARARERIAPAVTRLITRAQAAGQLRAEITVNDMPLIQLMIASVVDYTCHVQPELWRRYLALVIDGLRSRLDTGDLPQPALDDAVLAEAMGSWRPTRRGP